MLFDLLFAPFVDYGFMRRALVGACALAVSGSPLGVFLVLRRMSLAGDALSHAILPGVAVGYLVAGLSLPAMTLGGLAAGFVVALASGAAARFSALREDAALAAFYLVSLALDDGAIYLLAGVATLTLALLGAFYRALVVDTLDPIFLRRASPLGEFVPFLFLALVVLNLVAGFQALGTLMAVGLIMLPAAAARLWTRDLATTLGLAAAIGVVSAYAGLLASYHSGAPSGPAIVLAAGVAYLVSLLFGRAGGAMRALRRIEEDQA
jgi:zinc/manganese transport system permease protein